MQSITSQSHVLIQQDEFGRYEPAFTQAQTDGLDQLNADLVGWLLSEGFFACAQWYRAFALQKGDDEICGALLAFAKSGSAITVTYKRNLRSSAPQRCIMLLQAEFIKVLDAWCDIVERNVPKVRLTWDGERIEFEEFL